MRVGVSSFVLFSPPFLISSALLWTPLLSLTPSCIDTSFVVIAESARVHGGELRLTANEPFTIHLFLYDHYGNKRTWLCIETPSHAL